MISIKNAKVTMNSVKRMNRKGEKLGLAVNNPKFLKKRSQKLNRSNFKSELWFEKLLLEAFSEDPLYAIRVQKNFPILGKFFADFYIRKKSMIIEIDGSAHEGKESYDAWRDLTMRKANLKVFRIKAFDDVGAQAVIEKMKVMYRLKKPVLSFTQPKPKGPCVLKKRAPKWPATFDKPRSKTKSPESTWPDHVDKAKVLSWFAK